MFDDTLVLLFSTITLGLLLGRLEYRGLSLGTSGVIFVALAMGHFGYNLPPVVGSMGLVLFVYCLGISAGPSFFRVFRSHGKRLAVLSVILVTAGVVTTWLVAKVSSMPADLAGGIFAGAMTSTPALAAAAETLPSDSQVAVGFGIGYPFGIVIVVLFVQLVPRWYGEELESVGDDPADNGHDHEQIRRELVEVMNPAVVGKRLSSLAAIERSNCQVPRVLQGNVLRPIPADFSLQLGQHVMLVGSPSEIEEVMDLLGRRSEQRDYILDAERERMKVVVSSKQIVGKSLRELALLSRFGVTISRINRHDCEFVPRPSNMIEFGDALNAVGAPDGLRQFATFAGHRERIFDATDLLSVVGGVLLGIVLGKMEFSLNGQAISLGIAGGPLLVGLVLGHFGRLGLLVGHQPRASRMLMSEIGLVLFLATTGMQAGGDLLAVIWQHGPLLCLAAMLIAALPMLIGFVVARYILRLNLWEILGGVCGGMTSTPGLGVVSSKTDTDVPVVSYAAAYPVALILLTILGKALIMSLS